MTYETPPVKSWPHSIGNHQNRSLDGKVKTQQNVCLWEDAEMHGSLLILQNKGSASYLWRYVNEFLYVHSCM